MKKREEGGEEREDEREILCLTKLAIVYFGTTDRCGNGITHRS